MTTNTLPRPTDHRAPRAERHILLETARAWGPWVALLGTTGYITSCLLGSATWVYALAYGPSFAIATVLAFLWRYSDVVEDRGGRAQFRRATSILVTAALVLVPIGLTIGLTYTQYRATAAGNFAKAVGYAPGYSWDVAAAGYRACGELARGSSPEEVAAGLRRDGLNGDLHTDLQAARIVENARTLCPNV